MLWPFNHFKKPRVAARGTIEAIYGMIVTQAREPLFYRDLGVPDTVLTCWYCICGWYWGG
jgi:cytochrome b pre-mRNA-processing protein 3